jgi:antirestriction protein ArdC
MTRSTDVREEVSSDLSKKDELAGRVSDALGQLQSDLAAGKSENLVNYLKFLGRFHSYSFQNAMLIFLQRPDASHVAGFNTWKTLGRHVRKGEKGIGILAPISARRRKDDVASPAIAEPTDAMPLDEPTRKIVGFRVVHVFDVSQTDGEPLPDIDTVRGEPGDYLPRLQDAITSHGITLTYEPIAGGALGVSSGGAIVVSPDLPDAERFSVLVHEFAHELLHRSERRAETTKTVRETEAEAVAYAVGHAIGLQAASRSSDYIQLYHGDPNVLAESLHHIQRTAHAILKLITARETR